MVKKTLTYEEIIEICTRKCGCGILRADGEIECTNPYWCIYDITEHSGLD